MIVTFDPPHIHAATSQAAASHRQRTTCTLLSEKLNFVMEALESAEEKQKNKSKSASKMKKRR